MTNTSNSGRVVWPQVNTDFGREVVCILGVPFDSLDIEEAVEVLQSAVQTNNRCIISTANLNFLVMAQRDAKFRDTLLKSSLCLVDGAPIIWIARFLGLPLRHRAPGSSVFEALHFSNKKIKVFFFGGPEGIAQLAHMRTNSMNASVISVGSLSPGFGDVEELGRDDLIDTINEARAEFVVVALGAKKGQSWIDAHASRLSAPVVSHLGAVINFSAGAIKRAPRIFQRFGLEWLWRIKEEPQLVFRYWSDGRAIAKLIVTHIAPSWIINVASPRGQAGTARVFFRKSCAVLVVKGFCGGEILPMLRLACAKAAGAKQNILVDFGEVNSVDALGVGSLLLLYGHQLNASLGFELVNANSKVARMMRMLGADYLMAASQSSRDDFAFTQTHGI